MGFLLHRLPKLIYVSLMLSSKLLLPLSCHLCYIIIQHRLRAWPISFPHSIWAIEALQLTADQTMLKDVIF